METEKKPIEYRLAHVGVHTSGPEEAKQVATTLATLFNKPMDDDNQIRTFVGDIVEVKKNQRLGKYGHIAIKVDDVDAAMEDLEAKGVKFLDWTIGRDEEGKAFFAYMDIELCGFGIHLERDKHENDK